LVSQRLPTLEEKKKFVEMIKKWIKFLY